MKTNQMERIHIDEGIKEYGKSHNVPITLDDTLSFLIDTIEENDCKEILEIGTAIGFGSISIAENTNCQHIDTLEIDEERYKIAQENIQKSKLSGKISSFLVDAMDYLKTCNKKYDLVYLDGPKGQYPTYLPLIVKILNPKGIIFADNLYFHGMVKGIIPTTKGCRAMIHGLQKYTQEITTNPIFETKIYDIGDGVGVTKLKK